MYKKWRSFKGRIGRKNFFERFLPLGILLGVINVSLEPFVGVHQLLSILWLFASVIIIIPMLSSACLRLHDLDKSGWWQLFFLIPLVGIILLFYLLLKKGTNGPNRFGNDSTYRKKR